MIAAFIRLWLEIRISSHECGLAQIEEQRKNDEAARKFINDELAVLRRRLQCMVNKPQ